MVWCGFDESDFVGHECALSMTLVGTNDPLGEG